MVKKKKKITKKSSKKRVMKKRAVKRVKKRSVKKRIVREKSVKREVKKPEVKSHAQVRKEFSDFAKGVGELESLRKELSSLETKGFEGDVKVIRSKLHDVSAIPQIRVEINSLRNKIKKKYARKVVKRQVSSKLSRDSSILKNKMVELENKIKKKRRSPLKKQLSREEVVDVKDIPQLERKLRALRGEFDKQQNKSKMEIDSGVGIIVSSKFGPFLNAIKGELSDRIRQKEESMNRSLKLDLEGKEKLFAKRYADLVDEFHERYKKKVHDSLDREIKDNFDKELNKKLDVEKKRVINVLMKENISLLVARKRELESSEHEKYDKKAEQLKVRLAKNKSMTKNTINRNKSILKNSMDRNQAELERKKSVITVKMESRVRNLVKERLRNSEKELRARLESEYRNKLKSSVDKKRAELDRRKAQLEAHVVSQARKMFS